MEENKLESIIFGLKAENERLQSENERLKKQIKQSVADMKLEVGIRDRENVELRKQVDELTNKCNEIHWFKQYERAVKDTAREIIDFVYKSTANIVLKEKLCERYGVEVE